MADEVTFAALEGTYGHDYLLLADLAIRARYAHDNARDVVDTRDIGSLTTDAVKFRKQPALSAGALTDGTDLTSNTAYSPTSATATVAEVGLKLVLTDLGRSSAYIDDAELATNAGQAVLEKVTTDILALGSGFSTTAGSTTVNLTEANFQTALISIDSNKVSGEKAAFLYPQQWYDLVNDIGTTFPAVIGQEPRAMTNDLTAPSNSSNGMGGMLFGVDVRVNPLVPTATAGADSAGMLIVKNRTLGGAIKWWIRPEFERDASLRGTEVVVTACYDFIEVEDESGVSIITDR